MNLSAPAKYAPWTKGVYEVAPNLRQLGFDFGNGGQDASLIQLDSDFAKYRAMKEEAYADHASKFFGVFNLPTAVLLAALDAACRHLASDYPEAYKFTDHCFHNELTHETLAWTEDGRLDQARSVLPKGISHPLEALAFQVQPDLAIVVRAHDGTDWVAAVHVCGVSHWRPVDKLGQSFFQTHTVVPGMEKVNAVAGRMVEAMINQGPFVRFVWGAESDGRLNHHPDPPAGWTTANWNGRQFDRFPFWGRVERQTLLGLPGVNAVLFVIHAMTVPGSVILKSPTQRPAFLAALESMSLAAREYKGVDKHFDALMAQLKLPAV
jgi:hypothetical protein